MLTVFLALGLLAAVPAQPESLGEGDGQITVVVFLGVKCPLSQLYAGRLNALHEQYGHRVRFVAVASNEQDGAAEIAAFVEQHRLAFPLKKDTRGIADRFKATRNPEVVLV